MKLSIVIFAFFMSTVVFSVTTCRAQLSEVLILTMSSNSRSDQTAVRFLSESSDSFDSQYDAYKMINPYPTPNIYTASDENYAINALNNNFREKTIALHIRAPFSGTHTITAEEMGEFDPSWTIHLIDHLLNREIDLRENRTYSFTATTSDPYHRFSLKFIQPEINSLVITANSGYSSDEGDHVIYTSQDKIIVSTDELNISSIYVNDVNGHLVPQSEFTSQTQTFSPDKTGIYIVHVVSNQHHYIKKVMITSN